MVNRNINNLPAAGALTGTEPMEAMQAGVNVQTTSQAIANLASGGAVSSVNGQTGAVVLTTTNINEGTNLYYTNERVDDRAAALIQNGTGITWSYNDPGGTLTPTITLSPFSTTNLPEGTNLYFTDARAKTATISQTITNGVTNFAPSEDAVFDALANKQPLDDQLTSVAGLVYAGNALEVIRVNAGETAFELATVSGGATDINGLTDAVADYVTTFNIGLGQGALDSFTTGDQNTALGFNALTDNTSGQFNVAIGYGALENNVDGVSSVAIGRLALNSQTTNGQNVAVGASALQVNDGTGNVALGHSSLSGNAAGTDNIAIGYLSQSGSSGSSNIGIGSNSLNSTAGTENIAIGIDASRDNVNGSNNVIIGGSTAFSMTDGSSNVLVGRAIAASATNASFNTIIGDSAAGSLDTGSANILIGLTVAPSLTTGDSNIIIGNSIDVLNPTDTGMINIGDAFLGDLANGIYEVNGTLTADNLNKYNIAESNIAPTGSPFSYTNADAYSEDIIISGGTVTLIEFSRDEATYYSVGVIAGMVNLSPGDTVRVTYAVAPTITKVPR